MHSDVQINYNPGLRRRHKAVPTGTVDFGASDAPMTDEQLKDFRTSGDATCCNSPRSSGADGRRSYNVKGVTAPSELYPEALAGIFLGKITKWNDPELVKANPGVNLPKSDIVVVHRSDGSGTTFILGGLPLQGQQEWKMKVGQGGSVNWPVGLGGKGNEGVAGQIKQTANSIGYVELTFAIQNKMTYGKVQECRGRIRPSRAWQA